MSDMEDILVWELPLVTGGGSAKFVKDPDLVYILERFMREGFDPDRMISKGDLIRVPGGCALTGEGYDKIIAVAAQQGSPDLITLKEKKIQYWFRSAGEGL
jgi:hypothetical protein